MFSVMPSGLVPGVEQEPVLAAALGDRDQGREPVLGDEHVGRRAAVHDRSGPGRAAARSPRAAPGPDPA